MAKAKSTVAAARSQSSVARSPLPLDVAEIPLKLIDPCGHNPREDFDDAELQTLAGSIAEVGLLEPIIVRPVGPRYEIVAGERRYRACRIAGKPSVTCSIRRLDDRQAAEIRLLENLDRKSLSALEEATAFRQLRDLGHTPETLARLTRLTEAVVSGRLGLLELPDVWRERMRNGELSPAAAEYLAPWHDVEPVMAAMEAAFAQWPMPLVQWRHHLTQSVMTRSRSMDVDDPTGPAFVATDEQRDELDVRELAISPTDRRLRAVNVELWDRLQDEAESFSSKPRWVPTASGEPGHAKHAKPTSKRATDEDAEPAESTTPAVSTAAFEKRLAEWEAARLQRLIANKLTTLSVPRLLEVCQSLDFDPAADWSLSPSFLELFDSPERLRALADELRVDVSQCRVRAEVVAVLLHEDPYPLPSAIERLYAIADAVA